MIALMIARLTVRDPVKLREYLTRTRTVAGPFGAEMLFRGRAHRALTGPAPDHDLAIVVRFPDLDRIDAWIRSDAYRPLESLREEAADIRMIGYAAIEDGAP